jgi:capsular exopolysaccharide synthesis family protein
VKLLKQYYPYLVLAVMVGTGLGVGLHFLLLYTYPRYTSTVMFECLGKRDKPTEGRSDSGRDEQERFFGTQVQLMTSTLIWDAALDAREIRDTKWAQPFMDEKKAIDKTAAKRELDKQISARPVPQSNFIQLKMTTGDPTDAAILVNAVANAYMTDVRRTGNSGFAEQKRALDEQVRKLEDDIQRLKGEREQVLKDVKLDSTDISSSGETKMFDDLQKMKNESMTQLSAVQAQQDKMRQNLQDVNAQNYPDDLRAQAQEDHVVQQYDQKLASLRDSLGAMKKQGYGEKHPDVISIQAQIDECLINRQQTIEDVLKRLWAAQVTQIDNAMKSLDAQRKKIEGELAQITDRRQLIAQATVHVHSLDHEIDLATDSLQQAQSDLRSITSLNSRPNDNTASLGDRVRIVSSGAVPKGVSFPKLEIIVPATAVLFTGLVGGFLFLREVLDQRVRGPSDAAMVPRVKVVGIVPDAAEDPSRPTSIETVFRDNPTGVLTESYRQMRAPLIQAMERAGHKSLVVLGCMPGSGATSVASNMALAVAGAEERVLIIDANFRRPAMHRVFKLQDGPGLGDILAGSTTLDQAIQETSTENLKVLTAGSAASRATPERLAGEAMSRLLLEASTRFDMIIVDVPPAVVSGDGYALANKCDAAAIVCRAMVEKRGLLARVRNQLAESRADCLGVVVNAVRASAGGYFKRNIKATHAYQSNGKA